MNKLIEYGKRFNAWYDDLKEPKRLLYLVALVLIVNVIGYSLKSEASMIFVAFSYIAIVAIRIVPNWFKTKE